MFPHASTIHNSSPSAFPYGLTAADLAMEIDTVPVAASAEAKSAARSCTTCAKAKAKCVRAHGQLMCERCARLHKECHMREPVARKRKIVKTTRAAQLEKLESKLENLVNALSTSQAKQQLNDYGQPSPPISSVSSSEQQVDKFELARKASEERAKKLVNTLCREDSEAFPESSVSATSSNKASPEGFGQSATNRAASGPGIQHGGDQACPGTSVFEAQMLLDRYRRHMANAMPFVPLTSDMTVESLSTTKPFLLHAICCVASFHDLGRQNNLIKGIMRDVSERILINNEKSIDILQGILVIVNWYHPHIFWLQQVTNLLHLASAMLKDLNMDRVPHDCDKQHFKASIQKMKEMHMHENRDQAMEPTPALRPPHKPPGTYVPEHTWAAKEKKDSLEDHRALAGVFYLTSSLSSSFKKCDALKYTTYLDSCLKTLEQTGEYESDLFLVQMVRLQHVCEDVHTTDTPGAPLGLYSKAFMSELDDVRSDDKCRKDENSLLLDLQNKTADILVWELALIDLHEGMKTNEESLNATMLSRKKIKQEPLRSHLDDLYQCTKAIKSFMDSFFSIPPSLYLAMSFPIFGQFAHALILATRLASLEMEGWDFALMQDQFDFASMLEQAAAGFDAATRSAPDAIAVNNDCFAKWAQRIRWMRQVYEGKLFDTENKGEAKQDFDTPAVTEGSSVMSTQQQFTPPDDVMSGDFFNYLDENFWQSFAGDFDLGVPDLNVGIVRQYDPAAGMQTYE